jgi:hypothetical protein
MTTPNPSVSYVPWYFSLGSFENVLTSTIIVLDPKEQRYACHSTFHNHNRVFNNDHIYTLNERETVPIQQFCGNLLSIDTTSGSI